MMVPMRLLGIDYGSKRIGLALSDETGGFALPFGVVANDEQAVKEIAKMVADNNVSRIVIGKSVDYHGRPNLIMKRVESFGRALAEESKVEIVYHNEVLSSKEAERIIGRDKHYDARAAAIILKSYLDQNVLR